jgi:hypothetical protein
MHRRFPERSSQILTLEIAAKEYMWLWDLHYGASTEVTATREALAASRVRFGVSRALGQEKAFLGETAIRPPRLVPLFPIGPYTPSSTCGHRGPIETGSLLCCMVCHTSGMDEHPALWHDITTAPTPKRTVTSPTQRISHMTRRERRQKLHSADFPYRSKVAVVRTVT